MAPEELEGTNELEVLDELGKVDVGASVVEALVMKPVERHLVFVVPVAPAALVSVPLPKLYGALLMLGKGLLTAASGVLTMAS